ncbi:MAG: hypothetical protein CMJ78_09015 [Planctomycetaceae bacterium]|nr:hypothetical protein [Planctomycetaceae bacterium]
MEHQAFDPYHKWLGIKPEEQPPHHYRLLGISTFEADDDVIDSAAERHMTFLQTCSTGEHIEDSQRLLNEVAAARVCLLNPKKKAAYDRKLRQQLEQPQSDDIQTEAAPEIDIQSAGPIRRRTQGSLIGIVGISVVGLLTLAGIYQFFIAGGDADLGQAANGNTNSTVDNGENPVPPIIDPPHEELLEKWKPLSTKPANIELPQSGVRAFGSSRRLASMYPGTRYFLSVNTDGEARLINLENGHVARTFKSSGGKIGHAAISKDGQKVATASKSGIEVWDVAADKKIGDLKSSGKIESQHVAFSSDGNSIISGDSDFTIRVWDIEKQAVSAVLAGHGRPIRAVALSPDGKRAISVSSGDTKFWNLSTERPDQSGTPRNTHAVAYSSDGRFVVTGGEDEIIRLWETEGPRLRGQWAGHDSPIKSLRFSFDDKTVLSGDDSGVVLLWDVLTGSELTAFEEIEEPITDLDFINGTLALAATPTQVMAFALKASDSPTRPDPVARTDETSSGKVRYLRTLKPIEVVTGHEEWNVDNVIKLKGKPSKNGIWLHPNKTVDDHEVGSIEFDISEIPANLRLFTGAVALNDTARGDSYPITFQVIGDGKPLWNSKPLSVVGSEQGFSLDLSTVKKLRLETSSKTRFNAHSVWIEPRFVSQGTQNLLADFDSLEQTEGKWSQFGGEIISPSDGGLLTLPVHVPELYRIRMKAKQVAGNATFGVGIVVGDGNRTLVALNGWQGTVSGLHQLNGKEGKDNITAAPGKGIFHSDDESTIVITVLRKQVKVYFDDVKVIDWEGEANDFSWPSNHPWIPGRKLALTTVDGSQYRISSMELETIFDTDQVTEPITPVTPVTPPAALPELVMTDTVKARGDALNKYGGTAESERAVEAGLKWLADHQRANGSWSINYRLAGVCDGTCTQTGDFKTAHSAATGMALLAFLGAGHTHKEGDYQATVQRGINYLLDVATRVAAGIDMRGLVDRAGMYSQGISTYALCEAYRLTNDPLLKSTCQGAIDFIIKAQHPSNGGWRYKPLEVGDISVTAWQLMALNSARTGRLRVRPNIFKGVESFLNSVQIDLGARYKYSADDKRKMYRSATGIGLHLRILLGAKQDNEGLRRGVDYILEEGWHPTHAYANYYATMLMFQYGGNAWDQWNAEMRSKLVATQSTSGHAKGSWSARGEYAPQGGRLYETCLSLYMLETYYRHKRTYEN